MAGMKIVVIACDKEGNIDFKDLKSKAEQYSKNLSALMVTYPSTHGVFEEKIKEICKLSMVMVAKYIWMELILMH